MGHSDNWPDELDALIAAPEYHSLLMENEQVRVLDTHIPAGKITPIHTHRWPGSLYILSWSDCVRRDAEGKVLVDSRNSQSPAEESAVWSPQLPPHTLENVGDKELHLISVEIKS